MGPIVLFEKILTSTAISTGELKSHCRNLTEFLDSIPSCMKDPILRAKCMYACVQTPSGVKIVIVRLLTKNNHPINLHLICDVEFCIHWGPVLQGGFRYQSGFNVKVEYSWIDDDLHLTIEQPPTPQIDLEAPAQEWRELGRRELKKYDISRKSFQINQTNLRGFIASAPSQQLRDLLESYKPMMITVHTLRGVEDGQIQIVRTKLRDWSSTAVRVNCKKTMAKWPSLFQVNAAIFVLYRWVAGQLEIGIGVPGLYPH